MSRLEKSALWIQCLKPFVLAIAVLLTHPAMAQTTVPFESGESALTIDNPHPTLFSASKIDGFDYLEATIDVENKGASVSWAPFLIGDQYRFFRETRFQLSQADSTTSFGVTFKYNPFNPRSNFADSRFKALTAQLVPDKYGLLAARTRRIHTLDNRILELLSADAAPCGFSGELVSQAADNYLQVVDTPAASVPADVAEQIQCILREGLVESEKARERIECFEDQFRSRNDPDDAPLKRCEAVDETRIATRDAEVITGALNTAKKAYDEIKQNAAVLFPAATRIYLDANLDTADSTELDRLQSERTRLQAEIDAEQKMDIEGQYLSFREALYAPSFRPIITASYISTFFEVLGGDDIDANDNMLNDNEHSLKSRVISLGADWRLGEANQLSVLVTQSKERAMPEENSPLADYDGYALTYSRRLKILDKDGYRNTKAYKESLFVPSINFGIAFERKECESINENCAMGILRSQAITPFIDFKISKTAQFRLGVPFKENRVFVAGMEGEEDEVEFRATIAFQLGTPK